MKKIKLGSLLVGGYVAEPGCYCGNCSDISIGDTVPRLELAWLKHKGLLIADKCACTNISWEELNSNGFIWGRPVRIDGRYYLCRSLSVGAGKDELNEWGDLLRTDEDAEVGKTEGDLFIWSDAYFWGQEQTNPNKAVYAVRGFKSLWYFAGFNGGSKSWQLGFRPVLEHLLAPSEISERIVGRTATLYGPGETFVAGRVTGIDDYDLVLSPDYLPHDCEWAIQRKNDMIVSRSQILCAKKG